MVDCSMIYSAATSMGFWTPLNVCYGLVRVPLRGRNDGTGDDDASRHGDDGDAAPGHPSRSRCGTPLVASAMAAAACSKSSTPSVTSQSAAPTATIPTATTISEPVTYGYYDSDGDTMLSTDVSSKAEADAKHINYSPALITRPANTFPSLYQIMGPAAPNRPVVFGSEPGESDYPRAG
jgi:hypothetical protein